VLSLIACCLIFDCAKCNIAVDTAAKKSCDRGEIISSVKQLTKFVMRIHLVVANLSILLGLLAVGISQAKHGSSFNLHSHLQSSSKKHVSPSRLKISRILSMRGGKNEKKNKKGKETAVAEAYEDENVDADEGYDSLAEEEESNNSNQLLSSIGEMWTKTPPVTQIYVGTSISLSLLVFILNKNVWPEFLNLNWMRVFTRMEIWRPFTAFMFFGPLGMNYLLTINFVWTYMSQLEKLNFKAPEDFFVLIVFGAATLLPLYSILGLSTKFLGHNLSTYLVYIWARLFEGTDVNVMDLFLLRAEILPWFFCAQTLVLEGEIPFADLLGIVVGHLYHYLKKRNLLAAPPIVKSLFSSERMKEKYAKFSEDFELI
jgi:Derlin-2/3